MNGEGIIAPNRLIAWAFSDPWTGFILAGVILAVMAWIIAWNYVRRFRPLVHNLTTRLDATAAVDEAEDDRNAQQAFVDHYETIETAMLSGGSKATDLRHAWIEFRETLLDLNQVPLQSTTRPDGYFLHLGDDTRVLAWWANIFVALGLTLTFLGIIAALVGAVRAIDGGGGAAADMGQMQRALVNLLTITATKFWTSIGGVVASIILRWFDRRWHSWSQRSLEKISDRIERGTLYYPPQRLAAEQLQELKQQSVALTEFSHQLAASIGDALGAHMQPVVTGLGNLEAALGSHLAPLTDIRSSIDEFRTGSLNDFGSKLGDAIKENAGAEMQGLAAALTRMTGDLGAVNDRLEGASGQASEQIASAAREFSTASEAMTRAFGELNGNIDVMAGRLASQGEEAERRALARVAEDRASYTAMTDGQRDVMRAIGEEMRQSSTLASAEMVRAVQDAVRGAMGESQAAIGAALEGFAGATSGIQSAFDQMRGQIAELGETLSGSAARAASDNAEVLKRAAAALEGATAKAQERLGATLDQAIARSADASAQAIAAAFARFGERFDEASDGLTRTLTATAGRMETLAGAIERSTGAATDHADRLAEAGREAQAVSTMLGRAANDVSTAAGPIRDATGAIREAVGQSGEQLRRATETGQGYQKALETITGSMERAAGSATQAWDSYRTRFADVDEALAKALDQIRDASAEHATALNTQVGRIDSALAGAADKLGAALEPLNELGERIEDVLGRLQQAAE